MPMVICNIRESGDEPCRAPAGAPDGTGGQFVPCAFGTSGPSTAEYRDTYGFPGPGADLSNPHNQQYVDEVARLRQAAKAGQLEFRRRVAIDRIVDRLTRTGLAGQRVKILTVASPEGTYTYQRGQQTRTGTRADLRQVVYDSDGQRVFDAGWRYGDGRVTLTSYSQLWGYDWIDDPDTAPWIEVPKPTRSRGKKR